MSLPISSQTNSTGPTANLPVATGTGTTPKITGLENNPSALKVALVIAALVVTGAIVFAAIAAATVVTGGGFAAVLIPSSLALIGTSAAVGGGSVLLGFIGAGAGLGLLAIMKPSPKPPITNNQPAALPPPDASPSPEVSTDDIDDLEEPGDEEFYDCEEVDEENIDNLDDLERELGIDTENSEEISDTELEELERMLKKSSTEAALEPQLAPAETEDAQQAAAKAEESEPPSPEIEAIQEAYVELPEEEENPIVLSDTKKFILKYYFEKEYTEIATELYKTQSGNPEIVSELMKAVPMETQDEAIIDLINQTPELDAAKVKEILEQRPNGSRGINLVDALIDKAGNLYYENNKLKQILLKLFDPNVVIRDEGVTVLMNDTLLRDVEKAKVLIEQRARDGHDDGAAFVDALTNAWGVVDQDSKNLKDLLLRLLDPDPTTEMPIKIESWKKGGDNEFTLTLSAKQKYVILGEETKIANPTPEQEKKIEERKKTVDQIDASVKKIIGDNEFSKLIIDKIKKSLIINTSQKLKFRVSESEGKRSINFIGFPITTFNGYLALNTVSSQDNALSCNVGGTGYLTQYATKNITTAEKSVLENGKWKSEVGPIEFNNRYNNMSNINWEIDN